MFINAQITSQSSKSVITLTKEIFTAQVADMSQKEWKYLGDKPAIIDFYADWCGPCKTMTPIMEELATKYKDEIYVYKIDTEAERELASLFHVRAIPYFLLIPMNQAPQFMEGAAPKNYMERVIEEYLLEKKEGDKGN
jgi:thioredoxin